MGGLYRIFDFIFSVSGVFEFFTFLEGYVFFGRVRGFGFSRVFPVRVLSKFSILHARFQGFKLKKNRRECFLEG